MNIRSVDIPLSDLHAVQELTARIQAEQRQYTVAPLLHEGVLCGWVVSWPDDPPLFGEKAPA